MRNTKVKTQRGITLIALVITIIVLLILAAVSIATLTGENGILTKASAAKIDDAHASVAEGISLAYGEYQIEEQSKKDSEGAITFIDFLKGKGYIKENNVVDTERLLGKKAAMGKGTDNTDVYKVEVDGEYYVLNYYDKDESIDKLKLWQASITGSVDTEEPLTPPANAAYVIDVGYKEGKVTSDVKAYLIENPEASAEEKVYNVVFIGNGDIAPLNKWESDIAGSYYDSSLGYTVTGFFVPIKNAKISKGVTNIPAGIFKNSLELESVSISSTVTRIGTSAFSGCSNLVTITIPNTSNISSIETSAFYGTAWYNNKPNGDLYIGKVYYEYRGTMPEGTKISIKEGTKTIGERAFYAENRIDRSGNSIECNENRKLCF